MVYVILYFVLPRLLSLFVSFDFYFASLSFIFIFYLTLLVFLDSALIAHCVVGSVSRAQQ